ncbi:MAG: DUF4276 family protein [Limisphaera sp.]|nr:DUF4276 family protein [Limisphaera sp.]
MQEFRSFQRLIESAAETAPDLIVVGMDGNCVSFAGKKREILEATGERHRDKVIAACPDPHIERWYLADPDSFHQVVGSRPNLGTGKCTRDFYKRALADAVRRAGHPSTLGGMEFAPELVAAMDLYRAGKAEPSLGDFLNEFRAGLRRAQVRAGGTNGSLV